MDARNQGMATTEPRYQVFVSSTYRDLQEERQEVMQALLELECIPAGMELFPAANEDQWSLIKRVIDESDYYVLIVGGRYGSVTPEGISYTEKEFDYAVEVSRPILAFLHGEPGKITFDRSEPHQETRERLEAFRTKVQSGRHCRYWTTAEELGGIVSRSLVKAIKNNPTEGWVRGRFATSAELLSQINALRADNDRLKLQIEDLRTSAPEDAKKYAGGRDTMSLAGNFRYWGKNEFHDIEWTAEPTWDHIFSHVGPLMYDDASEDTMARALSGYASWDEAVEGKSASGITVDSNIFQTIKIQLLALGLIQKSDKKRAVADKGKYWKLTPYGENYLMKLRAIRKEPDAVEGAVAKAVDAGDGPRA